MATVPTTPRTTTTTTRNQATSIKTTTPTAQPKQPESTGTVSLIPSMTEIPPTPSYITMNQYCIRVLRSMYVCIKNHLVI